MRVAARIGAREIVLSHQGRELVHHPRLHGRHQTAAKLDHYLECLQRKPGALKGSLLLRQEREHGRWPRCFDELWQQIEDCYGASEAAGAAVADDERQKRRPRRWKHLSRRTHSSSSSPRSSDASAPSPTKRRVRGAVEQNCAPTQ